MLRMVSLKDNTACADRKSLKLLILEGFMKTVSTVLREGDVYRWSYREPGDDRAWGRYHCCSNIAIVYKGMLRDTYWQIGNSFSEGRIFTEDDLERLDLTRLGNMSDLEKAPEYQSDYYDDADIVNLNHSNSPNGNFYLRKGAKRSQTKMLRSARRKLEQAQGDIRYATSKAERAQAAIDAIETGEIENVHL